MPRRFIVAGAVVVAVMLLVGLLFVADLRSSDGKDILVGVPPSTTTTPLPGPTIVAEEAAPPPPRRATTPRVRRTGALVGLLPATGRPYGPAIPFHTSIAVPDELRFILVIGADARPGERLDRTRADSIHLLAVNPGSRQGTVLGFPRDAYVEIPRRGKGKINDALAMGGPDLLAETVRRLTGLPVHYYVLTGFVGFKRLVDDLDGVHVHVDHRMNDRASGARFERGWHLMDGNLALAYSRNRNDVPYGDFSRSQNQGNVILAALGKMRSEVGDDDGIFHWVSILRRHVALDVPLDHLPGLAALARGLDPTRIHNVVAPGRIGYAGRASVVYLSEEAGRMFADLRDDAVIGTAEPATTTTTSTTTTTLPPSTTTTLPVVDP